LENLFFYSKYSLLLCGKLLLMEVKDTIMDNRDELVDKIWLKLEEIERPLFWLAEKTGINYNTLYGIMRQKTTKISDKYLPSINEILDTDFKIEIETE
jgi:hypothetical protein